MTCQSDFAVAIILKQDLTNIGDANLNELLLDRSMNLRRKESLAIVDYVMNSIFSTLENRQVVIQSFFPKQYTYGFAEPVLVALHGVSADANIMKYRIHSEKFRKI